jgi:hypothetical protein
MTPSGPQSRHRHHAAWLYLVPFSSTLEQRVGGEQCAPVRVKVRHRLMTVNLRSPTLIDDENKQEPWWASTKASYESARQALISKFLPRRTGRAPN